MAEFGEQLKRAREKKGMTQQTLSEKLYVTRQSVSRWESGSRYPDLIMLKQIAKVLEVSTDELLLDDETEKMVEKSPIIVNSITKNIQIVLYALIVFVLMIQAIYIYKSSNIMEEITNGYYRIIWMLLKELVEAGLFIYFFIETLLGHDTPKKCGVVLVGVLILEVISRVQLSWIAIVGMIPFGLGAIGAYDHFMHLKPKKISQYLIYIACIFAIGINCLNLMILMHSNLVLEPQCFVVLLKSLIYFTFMYSTFVLSHKRKMVQEIK